MKPSIYNRIPTIPTPDLTSLVTLWTGLVSDRPTPQHHDYWGKCLLRACLELENRIKPDGRIPASGKIYQSKAPHGGI